MFLFVRCLTRTYKCIICVNIDNTTSPYFYSKFLFIISDIMINNYRFEIFIVFLSIIIIVYSKIAARRPYDTSKYTYKLLVCLHSKIELKIELF